MRCINSHYITRLLLLLLSLLLLILLSLSDSMQCSELCLYAVGWKSDVFNWQDYLSHCNAEAAPTDAFTTVRNSVTLVVVDIQCESKKSSPHKTSCGIFFPGKPV